MGLGWGIEGGAGVRGGGAGSERVWGLKRKRSHDAQRHDRALEKQEELELVTRKF